MNTVSPTVLIVEDDYVATELYRTVLEAQGFTDIIACDDSRNVMPILQERSVGVILLDLKMPHISGKELLPEITSQYPEIPVIILTGEDNVDTAVECMKIGAFDFMAKPIDENRLINAINHAVKIRELQDEVHILSTSSDSIDLNHPEAFDEIVTVSPAMKKIFRYVEAIAGSPKSVLITGESGTGKELIARAIHRLSGLSGKFVAVNVSGLDETMFSDTLFGHRRGAFTGADRSRSGLIEEAAGGTLFLDEIGDLQPGAQVKLLRLLQEEEYYPLGADQPAQSTARIITATNADLSARQQQGSFRKDLYYRLMAHHVQLPPLRMRQEDIEPLVHYFVDESVRSLGKTKPRVPDEAYQTLRQYGFPGNVRELQSLIYDAVSRQDGGTLPFSFFRSYVHEQRDREQSEVPNGTAAIDGKVINLRGGLPTLHEVEEHLIREALRRTGGNQSAAARLLGISQSTLSRRQQKSE